MTISVVIPAYNEEQFLGACLESLAQQTRPPDEIIVVDNNSTDFTAAIAVQYGATLVIEKKQGIMQAVHAGFSASSGEVIARCDADSVLPGNWLATIEAQLDAHPEAVAVTGPGRFYGTKPMWATAAQWWYMYAYFLFVGLAIARWPLFGSNCALRRSAWEAIQDSVHVSRNDIHDDIDISVHLTPQRPVVFCNSLSVAISARSLAPAQLPKRYKKGFTSLMLHWPRYAPWHCWYARLQPQKKIP